MDALNTLIGAGEEAKDLGALQMAARAAIIYVVTLIIVRLGKKRFMGRATAFDVIVGIVLGSIASRAITGNAPMVPSMTAAAVTMALHWAFSALAVRWGGFGTAIKGRSRLLVKNGAVDHSALRSAHMTDGDLEEALRAHSLEEMGSVAEARLERDGSVSIVKQASRPRIVDIQVESGVQTVRLELR